MNTYCLGIPTPLDLVPNLRGLVGSSPIASVGRATMRRMEAFGVDVTAHLDDVTGTIENWKRAKPDERAQALIDCDENARNYLFTVLPPEAKEEYLRMAEQHQKARQERAIRRKQEISIICSSYHTSFILMDALLEHYWRKAFELCDKHNVNKLYHFKIQRHINTAESNRKKTYKMCLALEGGALMQAMTQYLPHWWKDYDNVGVFTAGAHSRYMNLCKDTLAEVYGMCVDLASKRCPQLIELAANTCMAYLSAQLVSRAMNEGNKQIRVVMDEYFKRHIHNLMLERGKAKGSFKELNLPQPKPSHDVADATEEMLCLFFQGEDWAKEMSKIADPLIELYHSITKDESALNAIKKAIDYTVRDYVKWYFTKMVLTVKDEEGMPEGVKLDLNIAFNSQMGYCRVMRDVKTCAKLIKTKTHDEEGNKIEDCIRDAMDEIDELEESGDLKLLAFHALMNRMFELRETGMDGKDEYLMKMLEKKKSQLN